jgi:hypothetical protein
LRLQADLPGARNAGDDSAHGAAQLTCEPSEKKLSPQRRKGRREENGRKYQLRKQKAGQLFGCPALSASFEPEARIGSAHNYQELSPREKARRKFTSQLNSLIHL